MDSVDTNILVRYYTNDDPLQSPLAARLLDTQAPLFVPVTVVQELFWVLDSHCALDRLRILAVLRHLAALLQLQVQHHEALLTALRYYEAGLEFDDALHLALSGACNTFWTFDDKGLARRAARLGLELACRIPSG